MAALDFSHSMMSSTTVFDKDDFFRSGLPEMHSLKSLINVASRLFKIPTTNIDITNFPKKLFLSESFF